jgi:hypothetical protein
MSPGRLKLLTAMLFAMSVPMAYGETVDHITSDHESTSGHEKTHGSRKNVISVFTGVTHAGRRKNGAALGVGYERLLSDSLAIGVLAEHTFGDADVWVYAVPFSYRVDRWKFYVAPGIEESDEHGTESLVRLSAEYAFEAGSWEISPQFAIDFVDGDEVLIMGVVFGWGF